MISSQDLTPLALLKNIFDKAREISILCPCRSPRDEYSRIPPGPEGSNGSDPFGRRGVAGIFTLSILGTD